MDAFVPKVLLFVQCATVLMSVETFSLFSTEGYRWQQMCVCSGIHVVPGAVKRKMLHRETRKCTNNEAEAAIYRCEI